MKRLLSIFVFCCFIVLIAFVLFGQAEQQIERLLTSKESLMAYAVFSFGFLTLDIFLPVPSSLIMILNGKVLGVLAGTVLSLCSGILSSAIGFYLGRSVNTYIDKLFARREKEASNWLFSKFGNLAITISKALPILSEAISIVAGTTSIKFKSFILYSFVGHLIVSGVYAYVGSFSTALSSGLISAIIIVASLAVGWVLQFFVLRKKNLHVELSQEDLTLKN